VPAQKGRRQRSGSWSARLWQDCSLESGQAEAHVGKMSESGHRSCRCGAVYDRSEHIVESREISSFECDVCGMTIENWNSAWVPRYRFIACPATGPNDNYPKRP
jgi:hypothetical protein